MGGFASYNLLGGSVHALLCVKVNEITQGAGATVGVVLSHIRKEQSIKKQNRLCALVAI